VTLGAGGVMVLTKRGRVRGVLADGVAAFKGVPYAAPPFGVNRFKGLSRPSRTSLGAASSMPRRTVRPFPRRPTRPPSTSS